MEKIVPEESLHQENQSSEIHDQKSCKSTMPELDRPGNECEWFEERLEENVKRSFALNSVIYKVVSGFQEIALLDSKHYGKMLVIDGKMQTSERDEFIYHECLIHPALLYHQNPKTVFIMGGGGGFGAREALKHKAIEKVVICEIDKDVVDICRTYLPTNRDVLADKRLHVAINDAKAELEKCEEKFDVIVGDLADPHPLIEGVACNHNQLYSKPFYDGVLKQRLNHHGVFITQAGMTGVISHSEVFTSLYCTLKEVFKYVVTFTTHVPSFADKRGWILASDQPFNLDKDEMENRIKERITGGELQYLDAALIISLIHRFE